MTWKYDNAVFKGTKTNPKTGDSVTMRLIEDSDLENIMVEERTWGFDVSDGLSLTEFRVMVKNETKALLVHLNAKKTEADVTSDYKP